MINYVILEQIRETSNDYTKQVRIRNNPCCMLYNLIIIRFLIKLLWFYVILFGWFLEMVKFHCMSASFMVSLIREIKRNYWVKIWDSSSSLFKDLDCFIKQCKSLNTNSLAYQLWLLRAYHHTMLIANYHDWIL